MRWGRRRSADADAAAAARRAAAEDLERIRAQRPEVEEAAAALSEHRRHNEFADMFARALGGTRRGSAGRQRPAHGADS